MGYRRTKNQTKQEMQWKEFRLNQVDLIGATGLPLEYVESEALFVDFLMHGCIDHHEDEIRFSTGTMSPQQLDSYYQLVREYFKAGYTDPGLILPHERIYKQLRDEFPEAFE